MNGPYEAEAMHISAGSAECIMFSCSNSCRAEVNYRSGCHAVAAAVPTKELSHMDYSMVGFQTPIRANRATPVHGYVHTLFGRQDKYSTIYGYSYN